MNIRITLVAAAAALFAMGVAQAQTVPPVGSVRPLVGVGLTYGGDTIATVQYVNGPNVDIKAGGLLHLYGGADWRVSESFSLQGNVGWHMQRAGGSNGSVDFTRYPIELLAYYHATPGFRVGGGVRFVQSPSLSGSGVAGNASASFSSTTGAVVEGEWFFGNAHTYSVKARYVDETYKMNVGNGMTESYKGSHLGVYTSFYF